MSICEVKDVVAESFYHSLQKRDVCIYLFGIKIFLIKSEWYRWGIIDVCPPNSDLVNEMIPQNYRYGWIKIK